MTLVIPDATKQVFAVSFRGTRFHQQFQYEGILKALLDSLKTTESFAWLCYYPHELPIELIGKYSGNAQSTIEALKVAVEGSLTRLAGEDYLVLHTDKGRIEVRLAR